MKTAIETLFMFLESFLTKGRRQDRKKFHHNTWIERRNDKSISVIFWNTEIIIAYKNGNIRLDSGGFRTLTTKERMNRFDLNGFHIHQENSIWYIGKGDCWNKQDLKNGKGVLYGFEDNMIIEASGKVLDALSLQEIKAQVKLKKQVKKYAKDYIKALFEGNVKKPDAGDCFDCLMRDKDDNTMGEISKPNHLTMHIEESYFVPSLLNRAIEKFAISDIAKQILWEIWEHDKINTSCFNKVVKKQLESSLKRYMYSQLNLAS